MPDKPVSARETAVVGSGDASYPDTPPFHPSKAYPEYPFDALSRDSRSDAYELVRHALRDLALDGIHHGERAWNPLGGLVTPGNTVLIKPNLVLDAHPRGGDTQCLVAHGAVVRALLDYLFIAMEGQGRVVIGDSPLQIADFDNALRVTGIQDVAAFYRQNTSLDVDVIDFRQVKARRDERHHVVAWEEVPGDPAGSVTIDLGRNSMLNAIADDTSRFRVANYRAEDTHQYHTADSHRYVIARSVLDADVIIGVPKLKTHCKVGVTLGIKNLVGTVVRKQCLAHHRSGGSQEGGDEYPGHSRFKEVSSRLEDAIDGQVAGAKREYLKLRYRINERLIRLLRLDPTRDGGWHGNDTCWRMALDLARIAMYGRPDGTMADVPQRTLVTVIDGIVAGEGEGPLEATPLPAGVVMAGLNPLTTDIVAATFMGFDYRKIPLLREGLGLAKWPLVPAAGTPGHMAAGEFPVTLNGAEVVLEDLLHRPERMSFEAPRGWAGHLELGVGQD